MALRPCVAKYDNYDDQLLHIKSDQFVMKIFKCRF